MYGGEWSETAENGEWTLTWTPEALQDFYLNNVLIHEIGHVLDNRNTRTEDRERYANWFAIEYGYRASRGRRPQDVDSRLVERIQQTAKKAVMEMR